MAATEVSLRAGSVSRRKAEYDGRFLLFAVLTALAVRLVVVALACPSFLAPGREHWEFGYEIGKVAGSIAAGHGFGNPFYGPQTGPTALLPPALPYILAGIFKLFGTYTRNAGLAILGLSSLFSALTCIPIFFAARKGFGDREARWAAWVWVFFPYAILFSADMIRDTALLALLLTCVLWATLCLQDSVRKWAWAGFGLLCGVTVLTDPAALSVVPFLAGWACYRLRKQGRPWVVPAGVSSVVLLAAIAPWMIRNSLEFHKPVFLRDGFALELCVGNVGNTLHWWNGAEQPSGSARELAKFDRLGEQLYMERKWTRAETAIERRPGDFLWRSVRRFVYLWTGYWSFNGKYLREEPFDPANIPFCAGVTLLALIGLRKMRARNAAAAVPYLLVLVIFPLVYYVTHPELQYRLPVDPEVVTLACCAAVSWRSAPRGAAAESPEPPLVR